jgi:hypothetical protein
VSSWGPGQSLIIQLTAHALCSGHV